MTIYFNEAMTYSTMEDQRRRFTGRPWHYAVAPKGNVISAGRYRVVNGKLQKIDAPKSEEKEQPITD